LNGAVRGNWTGPGRGDLSPHQVTGGPELILWGSSTLTSPLLEHGLADEGLLVVYPVLLGTGKRFFAEGTPARTIELLSTKTTPTGILINRYKVVGPLKPGTP
jgi:dihydrofolate reductase